MRGDICIRIEDLRRVKAYMSAIAVGSGIWKTRDGVMVDKAKGQDLGEILDWDDMYNGLGRSRVMRSRVGTHYWYVTMGGVFHDEKLTDF